MSPSHKRAHFSDADADVAANADSIAAVADADAAAARAATRAARARVAGRAAAPAAGDAEAEQGQEMLAEEFVSSITEEEYEDIPDSDPAASMKVLRNVVDLETGKRLNIVIRKITEPFWRACLAMVDKPGKCNRVCAVGTPGIGKTTSTPILIRMLLENKHTVVYLIRRKREKGWFYEFKYNEKRNRYTVTVYPEIAGYSAIASLNDRSTYYVVDPGKAKGSCDPDDDFQPKVIIVASPDERHWGESEFAKLRVSGEGFFKFFPLWSLEELLNARSILGPIPTEAAIQEIPMEVIPMGDIPADELSIEESEIKEIKKRYRIVGGVPRHIFSDTDSFKKAKKLQEAAFAVLSNEQVQRIAQGRIVALNSMNESQPKSAIMGYLSFEKDLFSEASVVVISVHVAEEICTQFMKHLWYMMGDEIKGWNIFEFYTRALMTKSKAAPYLCWEVGKKRMSQRRREMLSLGGCTDIQQLPGDFLKAAQATQNVFTDTQQLPRDIVEAAVATQNVLFHSTSRYQGLIDFLYQDKEGHFHAFQATISDKHIANTTHIKALEAKVGGANRLSIYYLVLSKKFEKFITQPADPKSEGTQCDLWKVMIPSPNETLLPEKNILGHFHDFFTEG